MFTPQSPVATTGGVLFNRKEPKNAQGEDVPILNRRLEVRKDVKNAVFNNGKDITSLENRSAWKYRIPSTSVVNKVGDCKIFCCFGWRLTAAQILWLLNLVCFVVHTAMVFVVAYVAWRMKDMKIYGDDNPYLIKIFRVTARWQNETSQTFTFELEDNNYPIDIAWATLSFFLISAVFHFGAVVCGLFEHTWFVYFRQIDDAFCWFRWLEYSGSASLMGMLLGVSVGIREQNTLALIFVSYFVTMWLGLFTELYSRPVITKDKAVYNYPVGRLGFIEQPDYVRNPNALHLISQTHWEGERQVRDEDGKPYTDLNFDYVHAQRKSNYVRRMLPHILGIFPFTAALVVTINHLEYNKWKLEQETDLSMPFFVNAIIYGSYLLFSSFAVVQQVYQYLPPGYYFGSEICYCVLSLTAKLWLGGLMLVNVIGVEMRAEDALGAGALERR